MSDWYDELVTAITEDDRNTVLTVVQRLPNIPEAAQILKEDGGNLVYAACQKGYIEVLECLSYLGVVFTETNTEKSPIQVACEYGQESIVEWYLERGVPILPGRIKPWEEESPLYIASKNGCHGIVEKLISAEPSLIKDDKVRQCLLYAACLSGDEKTVKKWLSPCIDINHPIQLVKDLTDCEKLTPLYAACSGGHINIINMLCDTYNDVIFTQSICNDHPEVIGQIIQKYIVPLDGDKSADDLFKKCIGYLQNKNLQVIHDTWLIPYCVTLVELDVSNNCLYELPSCLPWKLQNLKIFNASRNNLKTIEYPEDDVSTNLCLEDFNLSYNKLVKICIELFEIKSLVTLNLSNNTLMLLSRSLIHQTDPELDSSSLLKRRSMIQERHWGCSNLRRLDISHNALVMLPVEIHVCTELIHINASYNKLTAFPQPWSCPLEILDLSHNQLERFPVSTELFWSNSLKLLNISDNQLHEINEGIVKLSMLSDLIACNNKIERLPRADVWENRNLHNINLKHNKLGVMVESPNKKRLFSIKKHSNGGDDLPHLEFPVSLAYCLKELRLADNNLDCVPPSICHLRSLEILDLSNNPLIDKLPKHMGYLKNLGVLKLKGVTPTNISPSLLQDNGGKAKEIISELLVTLRDCKPYNKIKAVVLGKKDKGKTTLVNILGGKKSQKLETKSIVRKEISLTKKTLAVWKDTEIKLNVWDISGDEVYTQIHHSVFTPITLYILVWDFWSITEELDKIAAWISNIQAKSTSFQIVLVGTFIDRLGKLKPDSVKFVNEELVKKFGEDLAPRLCPVSCINNDGIDDLKVALYETAFSMKMPTRGRPPVIGRKIPSSYTMMEKKIIEVQKCLEEESKPLYLTQSEYTEVIESISNKDNDLQSTEETNAVTRFLEEIGVILHFSDQLGALDTLYFLDPAWLCDILVHILICPEGKKLLKQERGQIKRSSAERLYEQCEQFPSKFVKQYIELLERFEIATYISQTDRLFFPCQLPIDPPIIQTTQSNDVEIVRRLYKMSECPSGFWMRLITRMMIRVEQYEKKNWKLKPSVGKSMRLMTLRRSAQRPGSFNKHGRFCGLTINKPKQTYSREMIHVSHEDGSFCVEPVNFTSGDLHKGVLITEESKTANFAMMGVIVDEIEDIVQDFYPGLLELDAVTMGYHLERYALCSTCYQDVPLSNKIDHFTMEHCARMLVNEECITCPKGVKQELKVLVPDLLMKEIPGKFFMDISKLSFKETKENCLGAGVTGSVFKASYDGVPVAIKIYRSDIRNATKIKTTDSTNSDSGTATLSTQGSMDEKIYENLSDAVKLKCLDEAESIKSLRAIREMRQEVGITSRLQHPCIISLIGLAFRPKLMMALELAPLGSFRDILDKELQTRPEFNRYKNKDELFQPLFDKELTYKFVYQIAKGLEYLHSYGIIYKDLKSDNILAVSTNLHDPVNLKLSDYGISKFSWGGRSVGLVGTPGYQAPEILDGRPYDEKVDIFSFSMVIYEILTGKRPYYDCENLAQIIKAMKTEGRRPSIKDMRILTKFPCLESMMTACWENMAVLRPSAKILSSKCYMQNVQFLAQTWNVEDPDNVPFSDRCVLGPSESGSKPVLCIWDTLEDVSSFTIMDPDWLTIPVKRTKYECPHVVCMTTAGKHIWVGHKSCATVYSPRSGELAKIGCYELDDSPVQILSCLNSNIKHDGSQGPASEQMNKYKVFVALKHGKLLQFKTQKNVTDDSCVMRKTTKKIDGYSNPSSIVLRTKRINCMAVAQCKNELWIGSVGYIDIVDCQDFKVNSDRRINTVILLGMCKLPSQLHVYQIVNYKSQMYCLFDNSPYVLEFCARTYICKTVFTLDGIDVYSKMVATKLIFTNEDHEAYLGLTYSDDSDSDLSPSGECPPAVPPRSYIAPPVPRRNKSVSKKAQRLLGIDSVIGEVSDTDSRQRPSIPPKPVRPKTLSESCGPPPPRPPRGKTLDPNSGRSLPGVERNQSFSLPIMPKHDYNVLVTSIAIVKDTLWVGRSCGSISVVNIAEDTNFTYGRVIADLYKRHRELLSQKSIESDPKTIEAVKLINTGKYVAARYLQSGKESWDVAVAFWEGYGSHDIKRIDKYNLDIMNIEKNLARCSIGDPGFIASNSEEY